MNDLFSLSNQRLAELNRKRRLDILANPLIIHPWWRPCRVSTLLVTDGGLDFGIGDFGLSAFVDILLNDRPSYVRFDLTLAHLRSNVSPAQVQQGAPGIARSITGFRFDEPTHFSPTMYDEVWLFGIETNFHMSSYAQRNADQGRYPADRLGEAELQAISAFMNGKGGMFATGDHGALGRGLCGQVVRVRNMRHWDSFDLGLGDEVAMGGERRNDTNQIGHDVGSQFSDQSDDVPQSIDLLLYRTGGFLRRAVYPHPVLCGRMGRINILPDHPHEGECRVPPDLTLPDPYAGGDEYPPATGGGGQIVPEVIASSRVPAGNDARGSKDPTQAHSFGAISAYDGHRAGVGRVVCDATWHHFINVNLIGVVEGGGFDEFAGNPGEDPSKHDGFLSSVAGRAALDKIKNYYTNIGVWIARPENIACFNNWRWWRLVYSDRLMEATLLDPAIRFDQISIRDFLSIGTQARDVLGRAASQCQTIEWTIDWVRVIWPEIVWWIDPWDPLRHAREKEPEPLPVIDPMPLIDIALGGALVALRQAYPYPPEKPEEDMGERARKVALGGARKALDLGLPHAVDGLKTFAADVEKAQRGRSKSR